MQVLTCSQGEQVLIGNEVSILIGEIGDGVVEIILDDLTDEESGCEGYCDESFPRLFESPVLEELRAASRP